MPIQIKDVARRARVSNATVSRVLANKPYVSEETRKRVLAAVEELGYQPNQVARSLRVQRSKIIGLIISDIQNPFFTSLVRAVEDIAHERQYAVLLCNSDEDIEKETLYVNLMYAERVAGVVITPTRELDNPSQRLVQVNIPVVAVDRRMLDLDVDTVIIDNTGAAYQLTTCLIKDGHQCIGAVVGPLTTTTGRERREGYIAALKAHGLPVLPHLVRSGLPKKEFGYRSTCEILNQPEHPTALFVGNNLLTIGALKAIRERGLNIPDDIALAVFDEMDWTFLIEPTLAVVAQPTYELGQTATELLLKRIEGDTGPTREIVISPTILDPQPCRNQRQHNER